MTKTTTRKAQNKGAASDFDKMVSHNTFIENNKALFSAGILGRWVDWIQLGKPTPSQRKYHPETLANVRLQTNSGKFLVCCRAVVNEKAGEIQVESWDQAFMDKIREQIGPGGPRVVGVSIHTKSIVSQVVAKLDLENEIALSKAKIKSGPRNIDPIKELEKPLGLQSFFWKTERGETPPRLDSQTYTKEEISSEFAS